MLGFAKNAFAVIGVLALLIFVFLRIAHVVFPGYTEMAKREFGSREAIEDMALLYARVESSREDPELNVMPSWATLPRIRKVPDSWLPARFSFLWQRAPSEHRRITARYDAQDALVAIEFHGSRFGCFVSRDDSLSPGHFRSLHRLATKPLYVTAVVHDE